jgi:uncharacterized membrane protein
MFENARQPRCRLCHAANAMATHAETQDYIEALPARAAEWAQQVTHAAEKPAQVSKLARGLGIFSLGLGLAETIAPRQVGRLVGTRNHGWLVRSYGMREIAAGAGILAQPATPAWLWARVVGDAVDVTTLAMALSSRRNEHGRTWFGIASVAGVAALDILCAVRLTRQQAPRTGRAEGSIIINRSPEEVYSFCQNLDNLPRFLKYVRQVRSVGERRLHWLAQPDGATRVEWDSEILDEIPNRRVSWRSAPGSAIEHSGSMELQPVPGNRGTIVRVQVDYGNAPAAMAAKIAGLVGKDPAQMLYKDLRRLKQVIEIGYVLTTHGQSAGRRHSTTWLDNIAR